MKTGFKYDVFLCGPIDGVPNAKELFATAQVAVHRRFPSVRIFNPVTLDDGRGKDWYLKKWIEAVFESRRVVNLLDYGLGDTSLCKAVIATAVALNIPVTSLEAYEVGNES